MEVGWWYLRGGAAGLGFDGEAQGNSSAQGLLQALLYLRHLQLQGDALLLLLLALILHLLQPLRQRRQGPLAFGEMGSNRELDEMCPVSFHVFIYADKPNDVWG